MAALLLTSCGTVQIQDWEWCGDLGSLGASCFHSLSDEQRDIPKDVWDNMRFGQICTADPPDQMGATFADLKATIEKLCSVSGKCDYQTKKKLETFFHNSELIQRGRH